VKEKKLKWIKESELSKYNDLEKLSLFKIRRLKKDIETIERENEELLKKIKSNKEIIRKYNKGVRDKEKLITSILIDNNLIEVNFIRYCKERIGVYKKSKNYYWNIRLILNGKIFKDLSLCSDKNLSILLEKYGYLNLSVLKKIELLKNTLGDDIKYGFGKEREKYFSYENYDFIGFSYRMIKIFEEKLKSK
jgi:hypothetical protein